MSQTRIKVDWQQLAALMRGESVAVEHRGTVLPPRDRGLPVVLTDDTGLRVQVISARRRPERVPLPDSPTDRKPSGRRARRRIERWVLHIRAEDAPPATLLRAESGTAVAQLGEGHDPSDPEAHGYTPNPAEALDAGEAVPSDEVETFATTQAARARFAAEKVDVLAKRRANSLARRTREALMQARAHGVDASEEIEAIEAALASIHERVRERLAA